MKSYVVALSDLLATANVSYAGSVPDAEAAGNCAETLRHVPHGEAHASKLPEAPKNIILETTVDLRKYAVVILTQTVRTKPCRSATRPR